MATTILDFIHPFRSTAGIARQVKWTARWMKWNRNTYLRIEDGWKKRVSEAIDQGLYEEVVKVFQEVVRTEEKEEKQYAIIVQDEEILLFEEAKHEKEEDEVARRLISLCTEIEKYAVTKGDLGKRIDARVKALNAKLKAFHSSMDVVQDKARRIIDQLRADYKKLIDVKTTKLLQTERARFSQVVREAKDQVRQIKKENRDSTMSEAELKELWRNLEIIQGANKKANDVAVSGALLQAERLLDKFFYYQEDLFASLMKEAEEYLSILENTIHAYIDIVDDAMKNLPETIKRLKDEGFPAAELEVLDKTSRKFFGLVQNRVEDLYRYAVYNQRS